MEFLEFNLVNKHGVASNQGTVLVNPSQIESIRTLLHTDHIYAHHEVGSVVTMKTGDKHHVAQHVTEIVQLLQQAGERDGRVLSTARR